MHFVNWAAILDAISDVLVVIQALAMSWGCCVTMSPRGMAIEIVGREEELGVVEGFFGRDGEGEGVEGLPPLCSRAKPGSASRRSGWRAWGRHGSAGSAFWPLGRLRSSAGSLVRPS